MTSTEVVAVHVMGEEGSIGINSIVDVGKATHTKEEIDRVRDKLRSADSDNDGKLSVSDIFNIVTEDVTIIKKEKREHRELVLMRLIMVFIMFVGMTGIVVVTGILLKDSKVLEDNSQHAATPFSAGGKRLSSQIRHSARPPSAGQQLWVRGGGTGRQVRRSGDYSRAPRATSARRSASTLN